MQAMHHRGHKRTPQQAAGMSGSSNTNQSMSTKHFIVELEAVLDGQRTAGIPADSKHCDKQQA
jgi:hypothetical protein